MVLVPDESDGNRHRNYLALVTDSTAVTWEAICPLAEFVIAPNFIYSSAMPDILDR